MGREGLVVDTQTLWDEGVGNFVFVSHTKKPEGRGGVYGGEAGRRWDRR
jgi:hypothetical protein